ncbi:TonB-dependent receptor [Sphingobacterium sp.]|uniref:TonB-dependent receptor n=1 Tax=Sphingobacterium sp. TaxID=341027 RepID=UPI0031DEB1F3
MKWSTALLSVLFVQVSAYGFAQKITLKKSNVSLKAVLKEIRQQSGCYFLYTDNVFKNTKPININVKDANLKQVLASIFKEQPLDYTINENTITIRELNTKKLSIPQKVVVEKMIKGLIVDENGTPLPNVSVMIEGTKKGTSTNQAGTFSITLAEEDRALTISAVGYVSQRIVIGDKNELHIVLKGGTATLEEVVVVGYGTKKRENLTGAVATLDTKAIENIPASNMTSVLSGRLSGVNITQSAGKPGGSSSLSIRANGTWNNTSPLYVIDGVIRDKFAFDGLDPSEVENLSVLKDGASAAIYGSRAANGVILVTTKKGKSGNPTITYTGSVGVSDATKIPKVFNAYEQALYTNETYRNDLIPENDSRYYAPDELDYFKQHSYDWLDMAWKTPFVARNSLNVSGGTEKVRYFIGGNQFYETGSFKNLDFKKYSARANVEADVTDHITVSLGLNTDNRNDEKPYWKWDNDSESMANLYNGLLRRGLFEPYIDGKPNGTFIAWHPLEVIEGKTGYNRKRYANYELNFALNYKVPFVPGLNLKLMYNRYDRHQLIKQFNRPYPMYVFKPTGTNNHIPTNELVERKVRDDGDFLYERYDRNENYQLNGMLTYNKSIGKHDINALFVYEQAEGTTDWFDGQRNYFISSAIDQLFAGSADPKNSTVNGSGTEFGRISYVGRLGYTYANKYIVEGSFRYDGSVNFAPGHRWGFFPSMSASWKMSEENFFKEKVKFIDYFKLRASVGLLGNDAVGGWQWMQRYKLTNGAFFGSLTDGTYADVIPNREITWEKSLSYDAGFDMQVLNNRLTIGVGAFYKHTYDILGNRIASLPTTFGATMPAENYAKINTKGFEVELSYRDRIGQDLEYRLGGNLGYATNKLIEKDQAQNLRPYKSEIGFNTDRAMGYIATDILRTQADIDALPEGYTIFGAKPELGMLNYRDLRGPNGDNPDGKIDGNDQDWIIKHTTPPINYGFFIGGSWKSLSLDLFFQGVSGAERFYDKRIEYGGMEEASYAMIADYWTKGNTDAAYPRAGWNNGANDPSTFWIQNTSFLRLKNLNLSYQLPQSTTSKWGLGQLKLFFMGTNLFLLQDKIKAYDPENSSIMAYPLMKSYSLGINLSF